MVNMYTTTATTTLPMIPSDNNNIKEWLPMPRGITTDDSFADDLLQQFDKRLLKLPTTLDTITTDATTLNNTIQDISSIDSITESPLSMVGPTMQPIKNINNNNNIHYHDYNNKNLPPIPSSRTIHNNNEKQQRRSSAGDLLRRSSAFFKSTFDHSWKNKKEKRPISFILESTTATNNNNNRNSNQNTYSFSSSSSSSSSSSNSSYQHHTPTTISMNTTITIPLKKKPSQPSFALLQPPIISHYPPKPLKYTDVTLINNNNNNNMVNHQQRDDGDSLLFSTSSTSSNHNNNHNYNHNEKPSPSSHKTLIHRLSMPALRKKVSSFALNATYNNHHHQHRPKSEVVL